MSSYIGKYVAKLEINFETNDYWGLATTNGVKADWDSLEHLIEEVLDNALAPEKLSTKVKTEIAELREIKDEQND